MPCKVSGCTQKVKAASFCSRHYNRWWKGLSWEEICAPGPAIRGTGTINSQGYREVNGELEHRVIAAIALGRLLRGDECVHHVDENRANNIHTNLVICPDRAYHQLLHRRTKAYEACGNAGWLVCGICGCWSAPDDPDMYSSPTRHQTFHRSCQAAYKREIYGK